MDNIEKMIENIESHEFYRIEDRCGEKRVLPEMYLYWSDAVVEGKPGRILEYSGLEFELKEFVECYSIGKYGWFVDRASECDQYCGDETESELLSVFQTAKEARKQLNFRDMTVDAECGNYYSVQLCDEKGHLIV